MKFNYDEQFVDSKSLEEVVPGIIKSGGRGHCCICNNLCSFVDMDFQTYVCSESCKIKLTNNFFEELK